MKFYHGTSEENWSKIQEEGILYGRRFVSNNNNVKEINRCTYLAVDAEEANNYGDVLLEVDYNPYDKKAKCNSFDENSWQLRVYEPIKIEKIRRIRLQEIKPLYIRFGEVPEDGFSTIYSHGEEVGKEIGISCYRCIIDEKDILHICLPLPMTESRFNVFQGFIHYDNRNAYLLTGDVVGYGSEGEPLLKNVKIAKNLGRSYITKE